MASASYETPFNKKLTVANQMMETDPSQTSKVVTGISSQQIHNNSTKHQTFDFPLDNIWSDSFLTLSSEFINCGHDHKHGVLNYIGRNDSYYFDNDSKIDMAVPVDIAKQSNNNDHNNKNNTNVNANTSTKANNNKVSDNSTNNNSNKMK